MRKTFEEVGLQLVPGSVFGQFSGEVVYEWDAEDEDWFCSLILLNSDGGEPAAFALMPGMTQPYGRLFRYLEEQLLIRAAEAAEDWYLEPIRWAAHRALGYGHMQHERV